MSEKQENRAVGESPALSNSGTWVPESPSGEILGVKYWTPVRCQEAPNVVGSIDNLRLELSVRKKFFEPLVGAMDKVMSDATNFYTSTRSGSYRLLWAFHFGEGDEVATVGLGLNSGGRVDETKGFFEFNPNKIAHEQNFYGIRNHLENYQVKFRAKRFDLALDYPCPRKDMMLIKDKRKYEYHCSNSVTEYLGQRNKPGRVKLYDKQQESNLSKPLTRLEMTCIPDVDSILQMWPIVVSVADVESMTSTNMSLVKALYRLEQLGEPVEPYIADLDKRTKRKVKQALAGANITPPKPIIAELVRQALSWEKSGIALFDGRILSGV